MLPARQRRIRPRGAPGSGRHAAGAGWGAATLMGQEFGEPGWRDWTVLFDDWRLDCSQSDSEERAVGI